MSQLAEQDDEIDLGELIAAIWYNWWIVGIVSVFVVVFSAYYAFKVATPLYEASTRFELLDDQQSGPSIGQAAGLAALAGISLSSPSSEADALKDRILSRPFVESIYERAGFEHDSLFNWTLNEPGLISKFKDAVLGPDEVKPLSDDDYFVMAVKILNEIMIVSIADNGIIELKIAHHDGERAAQIANIIVEQTLIDIFQREREASRESLNYFASELLQVRAELDAANAAVRDYALTNSLQSAEELALSSSRMSQLRRDITTIDESVIALRSMAVDSFEGPVFVSDFPIATSLSFRRQLNLSANPSDWSRLSREEVASAEKRLDVQRAHLVATLTAMEARAKNSGAEALQLAALRREVEVQQAIYESVIKQFETNSIVSGFERASGRIIETAIVPATPLAPKKLNIVAMGVVLGVLLGAFVAVFLSISRGVVYREAALRSALKSVYLQNFKKRLLSKLDLKQLEKSKLRNAQELMVCLNVGDSLVSISPTRQSDRSARLALSLAKASALTGNRVAILDLSESTLKSLAKGEPSSTNEALESYSLTADIGLQLPVKPEKLLSKTLSEKFLAELKEAYGLTIILLPAPSQGTALARVFASLVDAVIVTAERKKTTKSSIAMLTSIQSKAKSKDPILVIH